MAKRLLQIFVVATGFLLGSNVYAQRKVPTPLYIGMQVHFGGNLATLKTKSEDNWVGMPGLSAAIKLGAQYRKERDVFGFFGGIHVHELNYHLDNAQYQLAYWSPSFELNYWHRFAQKKNKNSDFSPGLAVGVNPMSNDHRNTSEGLFEVDAYSFSGVDYYIRPSIGLSVKEGNGLQHKLVHLNLNYTYFPGQREFIYAELNATDQATSTFRGNYFSLGVEMTFNTGKKPKPIPTLPQDMMVRKERINKRITLPKKRAKIVVWDDKNEDGDTISILVNGVVVLKEHQLRHRKKRVRIQLHDGENVLKVIAHNEGTEGKNTCAIRFKSGFIRKQLIFESALNVSEGAILEVK